MAQYVLILVKTTQGHVIGPSDFTHWHNGRPNEHDGQPGWVTMGYTSPIDEWVEFGRLGECKVICTYVTYSTNPPQINPPANNPPANNAPSWSPPSGLPGISN